VSEILFNRREGRHKERGEIRLLFMPLSWGYLLLSARRWKIIPRLVRSCTITSGELRDAENAPGRANIKRKRLMDDAHKA
jgi:hypothetical protein